MDVEAKRIMTLSVSKLYSLRIQRGGLRLHRSLLLSMTMRATRDIYHTAVRLKDTEWDEQVVPCVSEAATEEPMDTSKDQTTVSDSVMTETPKEISVNPQEPKEKLEEDEENRVAHNCERRSRKRRGKTAVEPDFLPLKKARMDTDDEVLRTNDGNSCRQAETLTAFPTNRAIGAC
ncbi:immediate early response gene 2 protein-like [Myxocyprinus asiaticus]|uniref:immediate early response gene 2 protein-like n=1 Tax=Myxocyprinus asiaticus TaxID=70543 RepID=UPI002222CDD0|nr:immediate early response gene 2 protein-like [Myxocyprinus asiaticus]